MTLKSSITRIATIALAAVALTAPAASARPAEAPPATAAAQDKQSLRSSDANRAGSRHKRAGLRTAREYPTRPAQGELANARPRHLAAGARRPRHRLDDNRHRHRRRPARAWRHRQPHAPHRAGSHHRLTITVPGCRSGAGTQAGWGAPLTLKAHSRPECSVHACHSTPVCWRESADLREKQGSAGQVRERGT